MPEQLTKEGHCDELKRKCEAFAISADKRYQPWLATEVRYIERGERIEKMSPEEILQVAALTLTEQRWPELLKAIEECCTWVSEYDYQADLSPRRAEFLEELNNPARNACSATPRPTKSDSSFQRVCQIINAQYAAGKGGLGTPEGRSTFEESMHAFVDRRLPKGHGRDRVRDRLGAPSARRLCAIAALYLIRVACNGKGRAHSSEKIQRLCVLIWTHAMKQPTCGQQNGKIKRGAVNNNTASEDEATRDLKKERGWSRHIRDANGEIESPLSEGRILITDILCQYGLTTWQSHPRALMYQPRTKSLVICDVPQRPAISGDEKGHQLCTTKSQR
jgi:hypothetical protein